MNSGQRTAVIARLMSTSTSDCEIDLAKYNDPTLLMDLLIECHEKHQFTRELVVRRRIAKLFKAWK